MDYWDAVAALEWQIEAGVDEAILDAPVDRFAEAARAKDEAAAKAEASKLPAPGIVETPEVDAVAVAEAAAASAATLDALRAAMGAFELCEIKKGASTLVFADGLPGARVMIVGEAPGRDEDREGRPFVGRAGVLLDKMFDAIGLSRTSDAPADALYITNVLPWRPPQNRDPSPEETAMMLPFLARHIELAQPEMLVAMGNHATFALLGKRGITRLRGGWAEWRGLPVLPMFHPAFLLREPIRKREAWADLLSLKARLR